MCVCMYVYIKGRGKEYREGRVEEFLTHFLSFFLSFFHMLPPKTTQHKHKQEGNKICARKNRRVSRERVKKVCGSFDEGGVGMHPLIIFLRTLR